MLALTDLQMLTESRIQLHYAVQFIAATGAALADPQPDYSHTSLQWHPDLNDFVGALIAADRPFRVALDPVKLDLLILDQNEKPIAAFPLDQQTMTQGLDWLKSEIANCGADAEKVALLSYPPDDFPDHPIAHGAVFDAALPEARQQLADYYHETYFVLNAIVTQTPNASPVYIWPHHFDMATLVTFPANENGESSIGIGFSPGDTSYPEPYWYVTPYPYPDTINLPHLEGNGFWHTSHWVGAVLTTSQLNGDQKDQLNTFLQSAFRSSQQLLRQS